MFEAFVINLIIAVAFAAVSYLLMPKPKAGPGAKAQDITSPTVDAGTPLQVVFGRMRIRNPNAIAYGGDRTEAIRK